MSEQHKKHHVGMDRKLIAEDEVDSLSINYSVPEKVIEDARMQVSTTGKPSRSKKLVFKALKAAGYLMLTWYMRKKIKKD